MALEPFKISIYQYIWSAFNNIETLKQLEQAQRYQRNYSERVRRPGSAAPYRWNAGFNTRKHDITKLLENVEQQTNGIVDLFVELNRANATNQRILQQRQLELNQSQKYGTAKDREIRNLRGKLQREERENLSLKKQIHGLHVDVKTRDNQIQRMRTEIKGHRNHIPRMKKEIESKIRQIAEMELKLCAEEQRLSSLRERLQSQEEKNASLIQQTEKLKGTIQKQDSVNQSLTNQVQRLREDVKAQDRNSGRMRREIQSHQKRLEVQRQKEQTLRQTLRNREEEKVSLNQKLERLQQAAKTTAADIDRMRREIYDTRKTLDGEKNEKMSISNQLQQARNEGVVKSKQIMDLTAKLNRSYTLDPVHEDDLEIEEKGEEKEIIHEDVELYKKHFDIVSEWSVLADELKALAKPLKQSDDDEKQPAISADKLLTEYVHSYCLVRKQETRLRRIENVNLSDLLSHQNGLSVEYSVFNVHILHLGEYSFYSLVPVRASLCHRNPKGE